MASFDRTLIHPTPKELSAALREGVRAADKRCRQRKLGWPPGGRTRHEAFLAEHVAQREGVHRWDGGEGGPTSHLMLAWWTDHAGRRHYRVVAHRGPFQGDSRLEDAEAGTRDWPALLLLDARAFLRGRGGDRHLATLCGCGVFGAPEALGWMRGCCGPCHDRAAGGEEVPAPFWVWQGERKFIRQLAFSPNGATLASASGKAVRLFDTACGAVRAEAHFGSYVASLAFSPDGLTLAASVEDGVFLLDPASAERRAWLPIEGRHDHVHDVRYTPDGLHLAGRHGLPFLLNLQTGGVQALPTDRDSFFDVSLSPAGQVVLGLNSSGRLRFWSVPEGGRLEFGWAREWEQSGALVGKAGWSADGRLLAVFLRDDERRWLRVYDFATGQACAEWPEVATGPSDTDPTFTPDGLSLVRGLGPALYAWHLAGGSPVELCWENRDVLTAAFSPDGRVLATGGRDNAIRLWPAEVVR